MSLSSRPSSSRFLAVLTLAAFCLAPGLAPSPAAAEDAAISDDYRKTLATLLEVIGAGVAGEQVAYAVAQETLAAIAATGTEVTEDMQKLVVDEALAEFGTKFSDLKYLSELYAPFYAEHMSQEEIGELLAFYQSPIGQKTLTTLPIIGQNGAMAIQQVSFEKIPDFQLMIDKKLRAQGIVVSP